MMVTAAGTPASGADFDLSRQDGWIVVSVGGELNLHTSPGLDDHLAQAGRSPASPPQVAIDLSRLRFCDSSGINALVRAHKRISAADGRLVLLRPAPRIADLLDRMGLTRHLDVRGALPVQAAPA
ncbi:MULTISPECIES: STAS domain-containing protein [Actinomadura]|uniref:Anti-sigma factor antagonist n=1 Tax=Actinomadura yumaensis TaxID=111807 RepID=A0ABW2CQH1_9ACTN|nr:STAS domain-containing protein [Actinomadura sp. J1-007]MWK36590.1 anti-sigma factor antagonist [Actinomadura sp. J1-007]